MSSYILPVCIIAATVLFIYFSEKRDWKLKEKLAERDLLIDSYENELGYNSASQKERQKAGIEFENYIAKQLRQDKWRIKYNGEIKGFNDEGIDLICTKKNEDVMLVQCKNWAEDKIIHENYVFAVYGAGNYYKLKEGLDDVRIVFYATCRMSNQAKIIARQLGVEVHDEYKMKGAK